MKFIKYIYILRCYPECGKGVLSCYQFEAKSFEGNLLDSSCLLSIISLIGCLDSSKCLFFLYVTA